MICKPQLIKSCSVTYKLKRVTNKVKVCQKTLNQEIQSALLFYTVLIHTFQICNSTSPASSPQVLEVCTIIHPTICKTVETLSLLGKVRT